MKAIALLFVVALAGCGRHGTDEAANYMSPIRPGGNERQAEPLKPNFASIRKDLFEFRCTRCHSESGSAAEVPLVDYQALINSPRELVLPGNPEESGLIIAVTRQDKKRMPPPSSGPALSDADIQVLREWIKNGAAE